MYKVWDCKSSVSVVRAQAGRCPHTRRVVCASEPWWVELVVVEGKASG